MKTKIFVLLFFVCASSFAQFTNIPDAKFEEKLIFLGIDDVADGKVLTSKINTVKELQISSSSITDLTGIQDFTALTTLNCYGNQLTSLDLTKNTALTSLSCYINKLTSLNLANNTALKYLSCYSNKITSLDLSKNTALTYLDCSMNSLRYLNIKNGKNTSISKSSLRIGENIYLNCITVDDVAYANTNWSGNKELSAIFSAYDCSTITQIPDAKFEDKLIASGIDTDGKNGLVLNSSIATLTSLNVSNSSITDMTGLEGFTALQTLNCSNNSLPRIDISMNTALNSLDCSNNANLSCIQVADINTAKTNITTTQEAKDKFNLDCRVYTLIPDTQFEARLILIGYDNIADGKVETKKINQIQSLYLANGTITDLTGIQDFVALKNLDCANNKLTSLDLSKNVALNSLTLNNNGLTSLNISNNTALTTLKCNSNKLTNLDLSKNTALTTLECNSNTLNSLNLSQNIALRYFRCDANKITNLDLSKNSELYFIYCFSNELTSLNLKNGKNTNITTLNFSNNPLLSCTIVDNIEFAKEKWGNQSNVLKNTFSLFECSTVTPILDAKFEDKLIALGIDKDGKNGVVFNSSITSLTTLDVSNSSISDLTGLEGFTALKTLNCSNNVLADINISQNTTLTSLDCSGNTNLTCIQVADIATAKTNITTTQEAKDKFGLDCNTYTLIPDVNFEKKLINLGYDSTVDGKVLTKKIKTIKTLDLSVSSINDLTGIQDFTSLTSLNCRNNYYLASLDLSKNINLTNLVCYDLKITTLDISKNTKLTYLDCSANQLASLDLSNNIALETLTCPDNLLTNINVSNNTALQNLNCSNNLLPNLDVSKATALSRLECNNNKLTSIDVSQNKNLKTLICNANKLTYLNLKNQGTSFNTLDCTGNLNLNCITVNDVATANSNWANSKDSYAYFTNQDCATVTIIPDTAFEDKLIALGIDKDGKNGSVLKSSIETVTSLDISNSSINDLTGLESFKALTTLNCSNNVLKNLNLSKNTNITTLNSSNNASLTCIQVSDVDKATKNWIVTKDATTSFSLDCAIYTLIPDSNFEAKLINLGFDDIVDGKIKTANINKITSINLNRSSIKNLNGIEDFKALTTLNCSSNQLTSLDLSKNTALTSLDCSWNSLTSLNIKNGKNTSLTYLYMSVNDNLNCITVDDVAYAKANWNSKINNTAIFTTYDCGAYTVIKDPKFEDKLISLGIDTDGKNTLAANSSIEKITKLDVSNSSITDLTGIEGFKALTELNCSNNTLTKLNLNQNINLTKIECQSNQITDLDVDKCVSVTYLNVASNKLSNNGFSSSYLKALTWLNVSNNSLTYLNMYDNPELQSLFCDNNKLTSLTTYYLQKIKELNCSNNQINSLDTSYFTSIVSLNAAGNKLNSISFSKSLALESLDVSGNSLINLDLSKNIALSKLNCSSNKIEELNLSNNKALTQLNSSSNNLTALNINNNTALTEFDCSSNQLTALYLKSGNNTKLNASAINFKNNPSLSCILVDNKSYSDSNWGNTKDASASFETNCPIYLLPNNFTILSKSEFCHGQNNGEINITAVEKFAYTATINGVSKNFTDNALTIPNLAPGNYTIIITIPGENFEQKYTVTIEKAAKITGKSSVSTKKVDVEITQGTAPYTVFVNGKEQFETNTSNFSVSANSGDLLEVKTAKACEGIYSENLSGIDIMVSTYPNPTSGSFTIGLPILKNEVTIEISSLEGRLISTKSYSLENGVAQLTLENEPKGVYLAKIYLDTVKTVKIIKK